MSHVTNYVLLLGLNMDDWSPSAELRVVAAVNRHLTAIDPPSATFTMASGRNHRRSTAAYEAIIATCACNYLTPDVMLQRLRLFPWPEHTLEVVQLAYADEHEERFTLVDVTVAARDVDFEVIPPNAVEVDAHDGAVSVRLRLNP